MNTSHARIGMQFYQLSLSLAPFLLPKRHLFCHDGVFSIFIPVTAENQERKAEFLVSQDHGWKLEMNSDFGPKKKT